ncbi:hypothetical protein cyc_08637 [Cyclospora cayetanensis]|uniref:Uncharacterized protein n=1 Tax=Cyclospora cayetanensis TaxID=88456 RepID=A0A1D3CSF3_9EIME|nr:hypothetical protein cyc_08637 [Cyclospora cayetanensis]
MSMGTLLCGLVPEHFSQPAASIAGVSVTPEGPLLLANPSPPKRSLSLHPFYRLPVGAQNGNALLQFDESKALAAFKGKRLHVSKMLRTLGTLFLHPSLTEDQTNDVLSTAKNLFAYAMTSMVSAIRRWHPSKVDSLGRVFLVVDALYCAMKVLGQDPVEQPWWSTLMFIVKYAKGNSEVSLKPARRPLQIQQVIDPLNSALRVYSKGQRPGADVVVSLKRQLICQKVFKNSKAHAWDFWREEDEKWIESEGA